MICDRDHIVAVAGVPKKELLERRISSEMEEALERRKTIVLPDESIQPVEGYERKVSVACPILSAGDIAGAVMFMTSDEQRADDAQIKLIQAAALFLGKQMES